MWWRDLLYEETACQELLLLHLLLFKNLEDYNAQVLIILQNWLRVSELITEGGREFHNLTVEGKKEYLYESILVCSWVK